MRLYYRKISLAGAALIAVLLALLGFLISAQVTETRGGILGLLVAMLGPTGTQLLLICICVLAMIGALRLILLMFDEGVAAELKPSGIRIQAIYYDGLLRWSSIASVSYGHAGGWGKQPVLVIDCIHSQGLLLRFSGSGRKIVIPPKLLKATESDLQRWIKAASLRGKPANAERPSQPTVQAPRVFGRRG